MKELFAGLIGKQIKIALPEYEITGWVVGGDTNFLKIRVGKQYVFINIEQMIFFKVLEPEETENQSNSQPD